MIPNLMLNRSVTIKRRQSTGIDSLGNPTYGEPTAGTGWFTVYNTMSVALAFSSKPIQFAPEGERVTPQGTMYSNTGYTILPEDRVLVTDIPVPIEYVVISVVPGYLIGTVVDHYEYLLQLP